MSELGPDAFDAELAELLLLDTLAAGMPQPEPLDTLRAFLNEAVSRHLITFADDVFETTEKRDETLTAIGECTEDELSYTPLLDVEDTVQVRGNGIIKLLGLIVDNTGDVVKVESDEITLEDNDYIEGVFTNILVDVPEDERLKADAQEEDGERLQLSITTVDIFIGLREVVLHKFGYPEEQLSKRLVAFVDINNPSLHPERIVSPASDTQELL